MDIANRIKELRQALKLSQADFAKKLGKSKRTIQLWESGNITPPEPAISLIEQTFSVNPEWLRYGKGEMFLKKKPREVENLTEEVLMRVLAEKLVERLDKKLQKRGKVLTEKQKEELVEMLIEELKEFGEIKTLRIEKLFSA